MDQLFRWIQRRAQCFRSGINAKKFLGAFTRAAITEAGSPRNSV